MINHSGMSYSTIIQIAEQATVDLPFSVEMAVTDHAGMLNRLTTQSDSIDVADIELWMRVITVPRGIYQAVDPAKIAHWDKTTSLYRDGEFDGKQVSRQGVSPHEVMYFTDADANALADGTTDYATMTPGVFNADTLGIQPVEIGRPINNWHELFNEEFSGRAAGMDIPPIMIMDAALAIESTGEYTYADKGNMTKEEITMTVNRLIDLKKKGPLAVDVGHLRPVSAADDVGRGGDPVDVVAGCDCRARSRRALHLPAARRGLSRLGQRAQP